METSTNMKRQLSTTLEDTYPNNKQIFSELLKDAPKKSESPQKMFFKLTSYTGNKCVKLFFIFVVTTLQLFRK